MKPNNFQAYKEKWQKYPLLISASPKHSSNPLVISSNIYHFVSKQHPYTTASAI